MAAERERDTVFVRGLAPGTNHDELDELFSEIGPVKSAFVVVHKDGPNKGKSRGFGFVQYALSEDAAEAVRKMNGRALGGGNLILELAEAKGFKREGAQGKGAAGGPRLGGLKGGPRAASRPAQREAGAHKIFKELARSAVVTNGAAADAADDDDEVAENSEAESDAEQAASDAEEEDEETAGAVSRTEELLRDSSVVLFNLPVGITQAQIRKKAGKAGKVNLVQIPYEGEDRFMHDDRTALVVYTKRTSATKAVSKLDSREWASKGAVATVRCRRVKEMACNAKSKARCRLIVRNLPFNITDAALLARFKSFGPILSVNLPTKAPDADSGGLRSTRGFGFVQFACRVDAQAALEKTNGAKIGSRVVAVDWAVDKKEFERLLRKEEKQSEMAPRASEDEEMQEEESDAEGDDLQGDAGAEQASVDGDGDSESENEEGQDEDDESDDELSEGPGAMEDASDGEFEDEEDEDEVDAENSDEDDDEGEEVEEKKSRRDEAEELNTTLFIRNLLFETTQDEIFKAFKTYGPVRYTKLVKHADGRSRGSAFVNFYHAESAERALIAAEEVPPPAPAKREAAPAIEAGGRGGCGINLGGRPLLVTFAINKVRATEIKEDHAKKHVNRDKRHLYLAREGLIHAESGVEVPKFDLSKRERAEKEKLTKLKNPLFFVSPTRLSVRNLFRGSNDGSLPAVMEGPLKQMFLQAARKGLKEGLVSRIEGDEALYPRGWPSRHNAPDVVVEKTRVVREEADFVPDATMKTSDQIKAKKEVAAKARSKGYGFVDFNEHVYALAALRYLNNNPMYAKFASGGPASMHAPTAERARLIVEFAVENKAKLRLQAKRAEVRNSRNQLRNNAKLAQDFATKQAKGKFDAKNKPKGGTFTDNDGGNGKQQRDDRKGGFDRKNGNDRSSGKVNRDGDKDGKFNKDRTFNKDGSKDRKFNKDGGKDGKFNKDGGKSRKFNKDGDNDRKFDKDGDKGRKFNKDGDKGRKFGKDRKGGTQDKPDRHGKRAAERGTEGGSPAKKAKPAGKKNAEVDSGVYRNLVEQYKKTMFSSADSGSKASGTRWFDV